MIVFDLDDTLYKERDYVRSGREAVGAYAESHRIDRDIDGPWTAEMLQAYRDHMPCLSLDQDTSYTLDTLKRQGVKMGIITDGRSTSQRNKYLALGLQAYVPEADLSISAETGHDKTSPEAFEQMMRRHPDEKAYVYVGDNPAKDFAQANRLRWITVMLRDSAGRNIHPQTFPDDIESHPSQIIDKLSDILSLDGIH